MTEDARPGSGKVLLLRSQLSPELQKITDHDYDYPYTAAYDYPPDVQAGRDRVADNNYDVYAKGRVIMDPDDGYNVYFMHDPQVYPLALKINYGEEISEEELLAVKDKINKLYAYTFSYGETRYLTLFDISFLDYHVQAMDLLLKHGAKPFANFTDSTSNFMYYMSQGFEPGFGADGVRLYAKYGGDPNFVDSYDTLGNLKGEYHTNQTFLDKMVRAHIELGWVALMEAGGDPWARVHGMFREKSVAARGADFFYLPFIDYMIAKPDYFTAPQVKEEWIYELLNARIGFPPEDDLTTINIQRQCRAILAITGLKPTQKVLNYINYKPEPRKPAGYGSSSGF